MGCASSKKRTTSVEDLNAADRKEAPSKKNGQLASNDAKHKGSAGGDAIQIPGAHTSFMAPDGIPFIDEDVEEDSETRGTTRIATTTAVKPDVNRNVVPADEKPVVPAVAVRPVSSVEKSEEDKKKEDVVAEITKREVEMTQNTTTTTTVTTLPSENVHVEEVVVTTTTSETHAVVNGLEPASEEEQQKAAVKIQAGIRGYRDRQRVKALRASHEQEQQLDDEAASPVTNGEETEPVVEQAEPVVDGPAADTATEHDEVQVTTECHDSAVIDHTPEMDRAAVIIQASYKGYKTRKSLGKI